jgi:hypothetical protein
MSKAFAIALVSVSLAAATDGQAPSDFSGTWTMDESRSGSATYDTFVGPVVWVIQQAADTLTLERRRGESVASFTYPIRAQAPSKSAAPVAPSAETRGGIAYWDGQRLILETNQEIQGKTVTTREALALSNAGRELVIERMLEVEHGYTLKGAQNFSAVKDVFTKRAP